MPSRPHPVGHVALVGAGPGDPGLITRRGEELLHFADVVLYDRLVSQDLLTVPRLAGRKILYVGKEAPGKRNRDEQQAQINRIMVREARLGRNVVRLKGGDPFIFGRGGEEAAVLAEAGIPFEVVPGVTAALGAAATTGIPFTHRGVAQEVTFATAHGAGRSSPSWKALGQLKGTIVFYMGTYTLATAARRLVAAGRRGSTPVAVVERATTNRQRTVTGTLRNIAKRAADAEIRPPSLVIIGDVVKLRATLDWFERRPLFGKRVLDLRTMPDEGPLNCLRQEGAEVIGYSGLVFKRDRTEVLDRAIRRMHTQDWIVFTSRAGVLSLDVRLAVLRLDSRCFGRARIAAIGNATAHQLFEYFRLKADAVPAIERAEGLAAELQRRGIRGKKVMILRAFEGRDVLPRLLKKAGAKVQDVVAYKQVPTEADSNLTKDIVSGGFDAVMVSSGEIARNLKRWLGKAPWPERTKLVTIGPVTSAAVREIGWTVSRQAKKPEELIKATIEALRK